MENYIKITSYLANGGDGNLVKQRKNPLCGLLFLVAGILLVAFALVSSLSETAQVALLSVGVIAVLIGGVLLVLLATSDSGRFRFRATGARMRHYRRYVNAEDRQRLVDAVMAADMGHLNDVRMESSTNTLLHAFVSADGNYAILQVEEYIPHDFVPVTPPVSLDKTHATMLLHWING